MSEICQYAKCNNLVFFPRRNFCCDKCGVLHYRQQQIREQMDEFKDVKKYQEQFRDVKHRKCLSCGKMFLSDGPWNRRCKKCVELEDRTNGRMYLYANSRTKEREWDE